MKPILILISLALGVAICAAHQAPSASINSESKTTRSESPARNAQPAGTPGKQEPNVAGKSSNSGPKQTISGCLNQSGTGYTLTDSQSGTVYQLSGDTSPLSSHVGHEMQITGQAKDQMNENATGAPSRNSGRPYMFQVSTAKHLADQCGPSGATANGPSL